MNFSSVLIGSSDAEALSAYYTKLLGEPGFADGGYTGWQLGSGYLTIGPHSEVTGSSQQPGRMILNFETGDVQAEFAKLEAAGAIVVTAPYEMGGGWIATFADPDGNYFQLMTPMEMPSS
jgi:predicted enzyme related to lactoylglutathione lyase